MKRSLAAAAVLTAIVQPATAADLVKSPVIASQQQTYAPVYPYPIYKGRVAVIDGRTL